MGGKKTGAFAPGKSRIIFIIALFFMILFSFLSCWKALIVGGAIQQLYLIDGVYEGEDSHGPNKAVVRVTIKKNKIVNIEVLQNWEIRARRTVPAIPDRIIIKQSTHVDAVTGATNSSRVIMNAVHNAVLKAVGKIAGRLRNQGLVVPEGRFPGLQPGVQLLSLAVLGLSPTSAI